MGRTSTINGSKELVTLRERATKGGGTSLYLDYMLDGVRTREFLRMYLVPERTKIAAIQNAETRKLALAMKAKKILELQEGRSGIQKKVRHDIQLIEFLKAQQQHYADMDKPCHVKTIGKIIRWIEKYGRRTTLLTVDKDYILGWCKYMRDSGLSEGTVLSLFGNLNTLFNNAYRSGEMMENPIKRIDTADRPKYPESMREYLTMDELAKLKGTRCGNADVKAAFLFSCFTGLRLGDLESLQWENIKRSGDGWQVEAMQAKTRRGVYIPLSENAIAQLPPVQESGKVFSLPCRSEINGNIHRWVKWAGISKHISFHCARHTYATLLLTYGADIYTVSKLLGHTNVVTTQIYAKIIDTKKKQAVNLIPSLDS